MGILYPIKNFNAQGDEFGIVFGHEHKTTAANQWQDLGTQMGFLMEGQVKMESKMGTALRRWPVFNSRAW